MMLRSSEASSGTPCTNTSHSISQNNGGSFHFLYSSFVWEDGLNDENVVYAEFPHGVYAWSSIVSIHFWTLVLLWVLWFLLLLLHTTATSLSTYTDLKKSYWIGFDHQIRSGDSHLSSYSSLDVLHFCWLQESPLGSEARFLCCGRWWHCWNACFALPFYVCRYEIYPDKEVIFIKSRKVFERFWRKETLLGFCSCGCRVWCSYSLCLSVW